MRDFCDAGRQAWDFHEALEKALPFAYWGPWKMILEGLMGCVQRWISTHKDTH